MTGDLYEDGTVAPNGRGGRLVYRKDYVDALSDKRRVDLVNIITRNPAWPRGDLEILDSWVRYMRGGKVPFVVKLYKKKFQGRLVQKRLILWKEIGKGVVKTLQSG